jgi:hypothetical protein
MSKTKKKDPWVSAVNNVFKRKRADRKYTLPKEYILSVADSIWRTTPTKEIIYNTLLDMSSLMFEKGFRRKEEDTKFFREKQNQHIETEFRKFKDELDDIIHIKNIKQ